MYEKVEERERGYPWEDVTRKPLPILNRNIEGNNDCFSFL